MEKLPAPDLPAWIAKEVPFTRYRVAVGDGLHMHVMETGRGRPVLMVHGNPTWGFLYRKVAMRLQGQGLRLIMPDLIGFGFSDKPRDFAAHSIRNHSKWLGSLIDQLDLRQVTLVCQDWGGAIGVHPFTTRQDRLAGHGRAQHRPRCAFARLQTNRVPPVLPHAVGERLRVSRLAAAASGSASRPGRQVDHQRGNVARAYRYPFRRIGDRVAPLATARMAVDRMGHPSIPALEECAAFVRSFDGPKAMVWGRRDPVLARALKRTKALLGDPPVTETQAGHFLQEEVPDEIAAAVLDVSVRLSRASTQAAKKQA